VIPPPEGPSKSQIIPLSTTRRKGIDEEELQGGRSDQSGLMSSSTIPIMTFGLWLLILLWTSFRIDLVLVTHRTTED